MQRGDGGYNRQAKAVAGQAAALVETVEAIDDTGSLSRRNAWAVVLNHHRDRIAILDRTNAYGRPAAGVFQGVIDQIRSCTREEVPIAKRYRITFDFADKGYLFGFRGGVIEFDHVAQHQGERYGREGLAASPRFGFGDLQKPVEHLDELVYLLNGETCRANKLCRAIPGTQRLFEPAADTAERSSEIVSDGVGYVPHAVHQMLDAVEHAVDVTVEPRKLVLDVGYRDASTEVARLDFQGGAADRTDLVLELPTKQQGAADRQQQRHRAARQERTPHEPLDFPLVLQVATDHEDRTVGQQTRQQSAERWATITHHRQICQAVERRALLCPAKNIADDFSSIGRDEQIHLGILVNAVYQQLLDLLAQSLLATALKMLGEPFRKGQQLSIGAPLEHADSSEVERRRYHRHRADGEQPVAERQAERDRAPEPSHQRISYSRCRGPYGVIAGRSLCRSSGADG